MMAAVCEEELEEMTDEQLAVTLTKDGMPVINVGDQCRWCLNETSVGARAEWGEDVEALTIGDKDVGVWAQSGKTARRNINVLITGWLCAVCLAGAGRELRYD
jgi:hypothetical protein